MVKKAGKDSKKPSVKKTTMKDLDVKKDVKGGGGKTGNCQTIAVTAIGCGG